GRKVSRTEPRDASDKEEQGGKKSSKELSARSNGSHEATRRLQQGAPLISLSPTRSAPTTPHTRGGSSTHRRPTSSMSGDTPPPRQPDDSRPIDTQLLIQLAHDFGADERDAKALVARSEENALVAAATARVSSPIFTADSSPEQQPPSSPPPPDVYRKRKKSMSESTLPKRRAPAVANKGENSTAKAAPTERQLVEPAQLQRLLLLQKTLMTLSDASLLLRVARLVKEHTTVVAVNDGAALEFDLCLLKSPVIDRLVDMCSPSGGAVRSNGSA
uniref:AF-9 ANC1 homology domain-containing protein n=1 Tax=Plectus sambesii TaxID=2011161 RepID=A0A914VNC7_9BILA